MKKSRFTDAQILDTTGTLFQTHVSVVPYPSIFTNVSQPVYVTVFGLVAMVVTVSMSSVLDCTETK